MLAAVGGLLTVLSLLPMGGLDTTTTTKLVLATMQVVVGGTYVAGALRLRSTADGSPAGGHVPAPAGAAAG
ncbi:MAG TPA: hypothetical protein VFI47_14840 [Acidimicrobiales bacterium]|nr:hypothetical protein [Acidimicrobiales bacterium]